MSGKRGGRDKEGEWSNILLIIVDLKSFSLTPFINLKHHWIPHNTIHLGIIVKFISQWVL